MEKLALQFFPLPYVLSGERHDGLLQGWPARCSTCDRQCESADREGLQLCSYGLNFVRADEDLLVAGIVVGDYGTQTPNRAKMMRTVKPHVTRDYVEAVVQRARETTAELQADLQRRRDEVIADYQASKGYQADLLELLRPDLETALAQVHDYKQFVQQIAQNLDVLLETRFPGRPIEDKLELATHEEVAMYWTAQLMDEKLDAALYLLYPERVHQEHERRSFRFHGLVQKYAKIYQNRISSKGLHLRYEGETWASVEGNRRAIALIPHALLDNAIKYAPEGTEIVLRFSDDAEAIDFEIESIGPRIEPYELRRIFEPFYRGKAAKTRHVEGTGFGLAEAQHVARAVGAGIVVSQRPHLGRNGFLTSFSIRIPRITPRAWPADVSVDEMHPMNQQRRRVRNADPDRRGKQRRPRSRSSKRATNRVDPQ
jgi:signal transduction histidine kinase